MDIEGGQKVKEKVKKKVLVARKVPVDMFGKDPQYTEPHKRPIPISLVIPGVEVGYLFCYKLITKDNIAWSASRCIGIPNRSHHPRDAEDFAELEAAADAAALLAQPSDENGEAAAVAAETALLEKEITNASGNRKGEEELEEKRRSERKRMMERLHIFQRYRETREEHALRNWKRHSIQWAKVERELAKHTGKDEDHLLMCRLGEYRERIEEQELIEEALALLEQKQINFWAPGLRIGNDLLGLMVTMPTGGQRQIQRVVTNEASQQKKTNCYREQRKTELLGIVSQIDPFFATLTEAYLQRLEDRSRKSIVPSQSFSALPETEVVDAVHSSVVEEKANRGRVKNTIFNEAFIRDSLFPELDKILGENEEKEEGIEEAEVESKGRKECDEVRLVMAATHMAFHTLLEEVSTSVMTVHNCGPTAVIFEWRKTERDNILNTRSVHDGVQRFYFTHKKGVILPGSASTLKLYLSLPGPGLPAPTMTLQGIAIEPDTYKHKRQQVEALLERRQAESVAKEIIQSILSGIKPRSLPETKRRKLLAAQDDHMFTEKNADLHVTFHPPTFVKFLQLADDVYIEIGTPGAVWDRSIMSLHQAIDSITSIDKRSTCLRTLNDLVVSSRDPSDSTAYPLLYIICYDMFVDLPTRLSLPFNRSATNSSVKTMRKTDEDGKDALSNDPNRKNTPPQAAQADDKGKKGAQAVSWKGRERKGSSGKAAPAKGGKKGADAVAAETPSRPALAKIGLRVSTKPDSSNQWSRDRKLAEIQYRRTFTTDVSSLVSTSISRICHLFDDISESKRDDAVTTQIWKPRKSVTIAPERETKEVVVKNRRASVVPVKQRESGQARR
ncbi:MYCBP-associated protein family-domain-containing protein [Chytridium lagenaria]|nr:MYCBP-associated protein family-domain-containing protein [Chytridium lagenaria]